MVRDAAYVVSGLAVEFLQEVEWLTVDPLTGSVPPYTSDTIDVICNAAELDTGYYYGNLNLLSNDPISSDVNIPVTFNVSSTPIPIIHLEPSEIYDTVAIGLSDDVEFLISNAGTVSLSYTLSEDCPWMSVSPGSGTVPSSVTDTAIVTLDASSLSIGDYIDTLTVSSNDPANPTIYVPVHLSVESEPEPEILLSPLSVTDSLYVDSLSHHDIIIYNTGDLTLSVTFTSGESWLSFYGGPYNIPAQDSATMILTVNAFELSGGDYAGSVDFTSNDPDTPSGSLPVNLHVFAPDIYVNPASIIETLLEGESAIHNLYLENLGDGMLEYSVSLDVSSVIGVSRTGNQTDTGGFLTNESVVNSVRLAERSDDSSNDVIMDVTEDWLSISPSTGTILNGDIDTLEVTIDAVGMADGNYAGEISISSNDHTEPIVYIPVSLTVGSGSDDYEYLPADANMAAGLWPPQVIGGDVTYLVNYFRGQTDPCLIGGFFVAGDANGDCQVIGGDVTWLVNYFRGQTAISYCPDYLPAWLSQEDCPVDPPAGWPNCETPPVLGNELQTGPSMVE